MPYLFHLGSYVWLCVFLLIIMFSTGFVCLLVDDWHLFLSVCLVDELCWPWGLSVSWLRDFCQAFGLSVCWVGDYVRHGVCLFVGWVTYVW